ncbi:conjugal transfer protein MobC [Dyadobacter sp. CY343]|uniref:conjugal transfer protein MobC n=1 Tax=Dyadobacter sp. CY343 TaxID=2907299 RepID=UPI001F2AFD2A|nr:conjugal transfer protein MobC [Dyadobacter sp. CY343]MCE7059725.1 YWFCY domain-containing protein [Dyadobacter sp. CY343]
MASNTGENEQALRRILDMSRSIGLFALALHFYYYCYQAFTAWKLVSTFSDRILDQIEKTGLFSHFEKTKVICLIFLSLSLLGTKGRKEQHLKASTALRQLAIGLSVFFLSGYLLKMQIEIQLQTISYISITCLGLLMFLAGGTTISKIMRLKITGQDIFNEDNETFPQQERLIENEYSINLPGRYKLRSSVKKSWINFVNPMRGLLVLGSPGSGKTYFVIRHVLTQHIAKGFAVFLYDFKYDDLTKIAYNAWLDKEAQTKTPSSFYSINFDDLSRSHRCNPLDPGGLVDIADAAESARAILMGLNREWVKRQGDFFVESPINFLTAIIWFLKKYQNGAFCSLPHAVELMQIEHEKLFSILRSEKEIEVLINPFISAFINDANQQLEGQIASAQISMARLSSPSLYYVLSGNDFSLDINNPQDPKIVCLGNNPQKIMTYGAVISLYVTRMINQVNQKGKLKSSLIFDEFPTIFLNHIDSLIATARQNKVATTLGIQDFSQLRKDYGKEQADVIMNISGNIISGQVTGDTAKQLSERFGRILQDRTSFSVNRNDTSISHSKQLDSAIPASKIASLSSGEFVGMVADTPDEKIALKMFHAQIINDNQAIARQESAYKELPIVRKVDDSVIRANYYQIKQDVQDLVFVEMERLLNDPELAHLVISK